MRRCRICNQLFVRFDELIYECNKSMDHEAWLDYNDENTSGLTAERAVRIEQIKIYAKPPYSYIVEYNFEFDYTQIYKVDATENHDPIFNEYKRIGYFNRIVDFDYSNLTILKAKLETLETFS